MKVIGLTGGIASGKSTVAKLFRALGAAVVDADQIAREIVAPGTPAIAQIAEHFGLSVLTAEGALNRVALAETIFANPEKRATLNAITHPSIARESQARLAELADRGREYAFYEAALLVEKGAYRRLDGLIVVSVPQEVQLLRLAGRDKIDRARAAMRLAAQLPLADKIAVANWVIDNSGSLATTQAQVADIWALITATAQ